MREDGVRAARKRRQAVYMGVGQQQEPPNRQTKSFEPGQKAMRLSVYHASACRYAYKVPMGGSSGGRQCGRQ